MSPLLLLIVSNIYLWVGVNYYMKGQKGMCLAFVAYAIANVGFAWETVK